MKKMFFIVVCLLVVLSSCVKNNTVIDINDDDDVVINKDTTKKKIDLKMTTNYPVLCSSGSKSSVMKSSSIVINNEAVNIGITSLDVKVHNFEYDENQFYNFNYKSGSNNTIHPLLGVYRGDVSITGEAYANNEIRNGWYNGDNYICAYHGRVKSNQSVKDIVNNNYIKFYKHYLGVYNTDNLNENSDVKLNMNPVNDFFVFDIVKHKYTKVTIVIYNSKGNTVGKYDSCNRGHNHYLTIFDGITTNGKVTQSAFENKGEMFTVNIKVETSIIGREVFNSTFKTPTVKGGMIHVIKLNVTPYNVFNHYTTVTYGEYQETDYTWTEGVVIEDK